jgi:hypothetical protein
MGIIMANCHSLGKGKVKFSMCLTEHHVMKTYCGSRGIVLGFLTSAQNGGKYLASCAGQSGQPAD